MSGVFEQFPEQPVCNHYCKCYITSSYAPGDLCLHVPMKYDYDYYDHGRSGVLVYVPSAGIYPEARLKSVVLRVSIQFLRPQPGRIAEACMPGSSPSELFWGSSDMDVEVVGGVG
ncbi:hypothetical protein GGX14DRAFT_400580 [Mycena pura]|uniref:Uncharacterized protein n=1 Tax=Mycena pura TaxID=153505 RepID=A0AAD6V9A3_9AGAR|nr:hypothetical protein GGX14DRAFT_400580 [Mycena pura]